MYSTVKSVAAMSVHRLIARLEDFSLVHSPTVRALLLLYTELREKRQPSISAPASSMAMQQLCRTNARINIVSLLQLDLNVSTVIISIQCHWVLLIYRKLELRYVIFTATVAFERSTWTTTSADFDDTNRLWHQSQKATTRSQS